MNPTNTPDPKPIIPAPLVAELNALGGTPLVERFQYYWEAATIPHYPRGWAVPTTLITDDDETRTLYEANLLSSPNHLNGGGWVIYVDPGYKGGLQRIRKWGHQPAE